MGDSIFCTELNDACENSVAEDQLMWNKETLAQFTEFVKRNSSKRLWRKNRKLKKTNKVLRKENKHLKAEIEALKQERASREDECGMTRSATVKSIRRMDDTSVDGSAHVAVDNVDCSNGNHRKTFMSKIGEAILEALPKLVSVAVRSIITSLIERIPVWFGKRAGELCT